MSKHLLECLDQYTRSQTQNAASARALHYNALELKALVQEIRDSSDEKSGLQEFYDALERIIADIKGMQDHAAPFLNRVKKSEAPNYYDIIKHPMDLGTLTKKVKAREYKDKKGFLDDFNLIWDNCFEYNTLPDHPLRRSATILRTKGHQLLQSVQDVPQKPTPSAQTPHPLGLSRAGSVRAGSIIAASEADAEGDADTDFDEADPSTPAASGRSGGQKNRLLRQQQQSRAGTEGLDRSVTPGFAVDEDAKWRSGSVHPEGSLAPEESVAQQQQRGTSIAEAAAHSLAASARRQLQDSNVVPFEEWPALERSTYSMSEYTRLHAAFQEGQPVALPFASSSSVTLDSALPTEGRRQRDRTTTPAALTRSSTEGLPELVTLDDDEWFKQMRRRELFRSAVPDIPFNSKSRETEYNKDDSAQEPFTSVELVPDSVTTRILTNLTLISDVRNLNMLTLQAHPSCTSSSSNKNGLMASDSSDEEEGLSGADEPPSEPLLEKYQHVHPHVYATSASSNAGQRDLTAALSLLLGHNGFDGAHRRALDTLGDLVQQYIFNLGRTAKFFSESRGHRMSLAEVLGQTLAENGIPRPESLKKHIDEISVRTATLNTMRGQLHDVRDKLLANRGSDGPLPDFLNSPTAFMENESNESAAPPVEVPPLSPPPSFVSVGGAHVSPEEEDDEATSSPESIRAQIGLLQPYLRQRATTDWGLLDDAELPARMKKSVARPKVPASGKIPTKRRAPATHALGQKKQKVVPL